MAPIVTVLRKGHCFLQKYHLAKMAPSINNGISQLHYWFFEVLPIPCLYNLSLQLNTAEL